MKNLNLCGKFILILLFCLIISIVFIEKLLFAYGSFFVIDTASKGADAIIILGGNDRTRVKKAIELKRSGYGRTILLTTTKAYSATYPKVFKTRNERLNEIFTLEKETFSFIPSSKSGATSTFDEAYDAKKFMEKNSYKHLIIVTDDFHTKRALFAFKKIFSQSNSDIQLEISGANNNIYTVDNWYKTEAGLEDLIPEGIKYILYHLIDTNIKGVKEQ